ESGAGGEADEGGASGEAYGDGASGEAYESGASGEADEGGASGEAYGGEGGASGEAYEGGASGEAYGDGAGAEAYGDGLRALEGLDEGEVWSPAPGGARPAAPPPVDEELLTARVRANPDDLDAVAQLATLLEASDRDAELFALLSARIDEGDERTRQALAPRQRAVLERLARVARAAGRPAEAELYELSLGALGPLR
ncbi:MAG TPA: hypothetical protein VFS00_35285, partial [Polyangiaceae bacterium]|nr:hypothetical protein [Polyangiaceae bacterium]